MKRSLSFLRNLMKMHPKMHMRFISIIIMFILTMAINNNNVFGQEKSLIVTGVIKDSTGEPLAGVNVVEKGTINGTITDVNGKYTIHVNKGDIIEFRFIGFLKKSLVVGDQLNMDVVLEEDVASLNEVVVVGYGSQTAKNITGSISTVSMDKVDNLPVTNLAESLEGQVNGLSVSSGNLRPGESATLSVRQTFSFSKDGGSEIPLVVIDDMIQVDPETGLPTLDAFNRLDPSEIESITVLKDGSAAIYGSRASQGAIIVKTKRGRIGKTRFNYSGQLSYNDAVGHSKTMSAYDFGVWHNSFLSAAGRDSDGANLFSDSELSEMKSLNYDWLNKAWTGAFQHKHSLSMSGGNETATYFAGVTYFSQGANLGSQDYNKWNFRSGTDINISKDIKFSGSISANSGEVQKSFTKAVANISDSSYGSKAKSSGEQADYGYLLHMPKYVPWETTVDGEDYWVSPFPRTDRNLGSAKTNRTIAGWNYFAMEESGSKQVTDDFSYNVNFSLNYNLPFIKGLSLKGTFSRSQSSTTTEQAQLPFTLARYKNYNNEDKHLASEALESEWTIQENTTNSRVYYTTFTNKSTQANFFVTYNRSFGGHEINAMASVERSESYYKSSRLAYEGTEDGYLGTSATAGDLSDNSYATKGESGTLSYLGRVNYNYKSKYLLQFLFRSDASTKFAPENYWGFFPSVQVGWVLSEEDWFKNSLSWIDFLKVRYSLGKTGKDNITAWRWAQYYTINTDKGFQFGSDGGTLGSSITPNVSPNRDAGWDTTIKNNVGLNMNVLANRLKFSGDFYYDRTKDMFTNMASSEGVPISVGGGYAEENYAGVDAWGTEFSINWDDKIGSDFSYSVGVQFGSSNNMVKKYPEQALKHPSYNQTMEGRSTIMPTWGFETWKGTSTGDGILRTDEDITNYWNYLSDHAASAGKDPSYLGLTTVDGIEKGMLAYKDVAGDFDSETGDQDGADGQVEEYNDYVKLVDKTKTHGFTTKLGFKFKGISFSTLISTYWGGYREIDVVKQGTSSSHNMWAHESYWTDMYDENSNVDGKYPNLAYYDQIGYNSDFWQINTFRCFVRNMKIGYDIPKNWVSKANIDRASIGVSGNNLWDFYNPYPDHYRNMYDNSYVGYPTLRTWAVNVNLSF